MMFARACVRPPAFVGALWVAIGIGVVSACTAHPGGKGCPAGSYREDVPVESYEPERCVRPDGVAEGPFLMHEFDEEKRTWSTRTGTYVDGELDGDVIVRDARGLVTRVDTYDRGRHVGVAHYRATRAETREGDGLVRIEVFTDGSPADSRVYACQHGVPVNTDEDPRPPAAPLELLACGR